MSNYSGMNLVDNLYDIWHLADNILVQVKFILINNMHL